MTDARLTRRLCLLVEADIGGSAGSPGIRPFSAQAAVTQSPATPGPDPRLGRILAAGLAAAGVEPGETWRQDRGTRRLVLLPVAADPVAVLPLLIHGLVAELDRLQAGGHQPALRLRAAVTWDAVVRVKGTYAGRAVAAAVRLLGAPAVAAELAELAGQAEALLAVVLSDDAYHELRRAGAGRSPAGFHRIDVAAPGAAGPEPAWVGAGVPGAAPPAPQRRLRKILNGVVPALAGGAENAIDLAETVTGTGGATGEDEVSSAGDHLSSAHGGADQTSADHGSDSTGSSASYEAAGHEAAESVYTVAETHTIDYASGGIVEEYGTESAYGGASYEAYDYGSSDELHGHGA